MSSSTSLSAIRMAGKARDVEEKRAQERRRHCLVLILRHLADHGYIESVASLEKESGVSLNKMDAADNITLPTVLQEFEEFYEVKFGRKPKLVRKNDSMDEDKGAPKMRTMGGGATRRPGKVRPGAKAVASEENKENTEKEGLELDGKNPFASERGESKKGGSENDDYNEVRILKPIPEFGGSAELRELASIITRDIYVESPNVTWDSIAGLDSAKRLLKEAVVMPHRYPQLFKGILRPWKGILLYGPPGTGKTMLAKAVATECRTTFFNISASSVVSKWRGDSEKLIRVLFDLARYHAPSTIFLDELDSLMSARGSDGEHEASRKLKTELLVQMDGLGSDGGGEIFFLGATNLPWELDSAMLRRLEKRIQIPLPSPEGRQKIFEKAFSGENGGPVVTGEVDFGSLAGATDGFSGADVALMCKEAAMRPLRRLMDEIENYSSDQQDKEVKLPPVTAADIEAAMMTTKPTGLRHANMYTDFANRYGQVL